MKATTSPKLRIQQFWIFLGLSFAGISALFFAAPPPTVSIGGVINQYEAVTAVGDHWLVVEDAAAFSPGDKALVIQMKGASISEAENSTYGEVLDYRTTGRYEFQEIASVSGDSLFFSVPLGHVYELAGKVQVVRVPVYEKVKVVSQLQASDWDGKTGGIVVLWATQSVDLEADIQVRGRGFRGGNYNGTAATGGFIYGCDISSGKGGYKGEGIADPILFGCRGRAATGGGGGNDHNGGGGGGGNYGSGGQGGHGWVSGTPGSDTNKGGRGGLSLADLYANTSDRILVGGGGGGGHQNNGASFVGGDGGGIVFLVSPTVKVINSRTINASGNDAQDVYVNDGASGGGAGGSVVLDVENWTNPSGLTIDVSGGDGADLYTRDQHGPGGGGGGGIIAEVSLLPTSVNTELGSGKAGIFYSSRGGSNMHHDTNHGATQGESGAIIPRVILRVSSLPPAVDLDDANQGYDYLTECFPGMTSPHVGKPSGVSIIDPDGSVAYAANIRLTNPLDSTNEGLYFSLAPGVPDGYRIELTVAPDGHSISLFGEATLAQYEELIAGIIYDNEAPHPDYTDRLVEVWVDDGGSQSNYALTTIEMREPVLLPVEWGSIKATWKGQQARIAWEVREEEGADYYLIERAAEGQLFTQVGTVPAQKDKAPRTSYEFLDPGAHPDLSPVFYYRIRQVDQSGHYAFSDVVELTALEEGPQWALQAYPNPTSETLLINWLGPAEGTGNVLSILDRQGRILETRKLRAGTPEIRIDVSGWAAGTYFLQVGAGRQKVSKAIQIR